MLRVLGLDCIRLIVGDGRLFVKVNIVATFHHGNGVLSAAARCLAFDGVTHFGWCLFAWMINA